MRRLNENIQKARQSEKDYISENKALVELQATLENRVAERTLERLAEPLSALFLPPDRWPGALLDEAWLEVIRNSAHDSICACSVDEVCNAVVHRFAEATQIATGLADRALEALGATVAVGDRVPVVVNPAARTRSGVVEVRLPGDGESATVRVNFTANEAGPRLFRFRVPALEDEQVAQNNARDALVEVTDRRERVLYMEGEPRFEPKFIRRAVEDRVTVAVG